MEAGTAKESQSCLESNKHYCCFQTAKGLDGSSTQGAPTKHSISHCSFVSRCWVQLSRLSIAELRDNEGSSQAQSAVSSQGNGRVYSVQENQNSFPATCSTVRSDSDLSTLSISLFLLRMRPSASATANDCQPMNQQEAMDDRHRHEMNGHERGMR